MASKSCSSCITQLIECLTYWTNTISTQFICDNKLGTDCIYLDFALAFDTVPHQRLKLKLSKVGIHVLVNVLIWIVSF